MGHEKESKTNLAGSEVPFSTLGFVGSGDGFVDLLPQPNQPLKFSNTTAVIIFWNPKKMCFKERNSAILIVLRYGISFPNT